MSTCPICCKPQRARDVCAECRALPEQQQYEMLVKRFDESIAQAKGLLIDAYKTGNQQTVWLTQQAIKQFEHQKKSLRKPK